MKALTEELCGKEISSTQVSRFIEVLDAETAKSKARPLGSYEYVFFDAQYEKVRHDGCVLILSRSEGLRSEQRKPSRGFGYIV